MGMLDFNTVGGFSSAFRELGRIRGWMKSAQHNGKYVRSDRSLPFLWRGVVRYHWSQTAKPQHQKQKRYLQTPLLSSSLDREPEIRTC